MTIGPDRRRPGPANISRLTGQDLFELGLVEVIKNYKALSNIKRQYSIIYVFTFFRWPASKDAIVTVVFATGVKRLTPMNFNPQPTLEFLHDRDISGKLSQFQKASTCSCIMCLPTCHSTYKQFINAVNFGIQNAHGFGFA